MGTGFAYAAKANIPEKVAPEFMIDSGIRMAMTDADGTVQQSNDDGKTWQPYVEAPNYETYSVAEYEKYIEDYKASAPSLIASGSMTQEKVVTTIAIMEEELAKLKADNGKGDYVLYKPIEEKTWVDENGDYWVSGISMTGYYTGFDFLVDSSITMTGYYGDFDISTGFGGAIVLENGEVTNFGQYESREEMLSAVKSYCETEVKAGRMSQAEADKILADFN
jgi:hypothetical protein